jgi:hypothetical protein
MIIVKASPQEICEISFMILMKIMKGFGAFFCGMV